MLGNVKEGAWPADMTRFMAERSAQMSPRSFDAVHSALFVASRRMSSTGGGVRYLRSTYSPGRHRWSAVFAAADADLVHRAFELAQLPAVDVTEIFEWSSGEK